MPNGENKNTYVSPDTVSLTYHDIDEPYNTFLHNTNYTPAYAFDRVCFVNAGSLTNESEQCLTNWKFLAYKTSADHTNVHSVMGMWHGDGTGTGMFTKELKDAGIISKAIFSMRFD